MFNLCLLMLWLSISARLPFFLLLSTYRYWILKIDILRILTEFSGAALFAPMMNPYEPGMTKEEMKRTWENWLPKRKFMYFLARRFPRFLSSFYRRTFLSGKLERIDKWLSVSLGKKVSQFSSYINSTTL